jgi:siroheme synthase
VSPSGWEKAVAAADTAVLYMAASDSAGVKRALIAAGVRPETPVAVAENVSLEGSDVRAGTLEELPRLACSSSGGPVLILLGDVYGEVLDLAREAVRKAAAS